MPGLGGVHFLPYGWLHRTRIYVALAVVISIGAFVALVISLQTQAYAYILLFVGIVYWAGAPPVYRHAKRIVVEAEG